MKNNIFKTSSYSLLALLFLSLTACNSDDDLPQLPQVEFNLFTYGPDPVSSFETTTAYYENPAQVSAGVFRTGAFITDQNITLDTNNDLQGAGTVIDLSLFGDIDVPFQPGVYRIDGNQDVASAYVAYNVDFDAANTINRPIPLVSGYVRVTTRDNVYAIEINGDDLNGDFFHGIYLGRLTLK
jgi:hypothetical protein